MKNRRLSLTSSGPTAHISYASAFMGKNAKSNLAVSALTVIACSFAPLAHAANYFWDSDGTTPGFGSASGTWDTPTAANWSTDGTGVADPATTPGNVTTTTADTVNFGNGATGLASGTITINGNVSTGNITFASGSGAVELTGGTLTLAAAQTITVNNSSANPATISSTLAGMATSLTKAGTGTLFLTGTKPVGYAGLTTISGGTLDLGTINGTFGPAVTVTGGVATGSIVGGSNSFIQANGTLNTGISGGSAGFSARGGDLIVNVGGAGASISRNSGGTGGLGQMIFGSATSDSKVIVQNAVNLNNTNGSRDFTVLGSTVAEISGAITNASSGLVKAGTGVLILSGANTYGSTTTLTNSTQINAGTLQIGNGTDVGVLPTNKNILLNNVSATLAYNVGSGTRTQSNIITGAGNVTQESAGGVLNLTGANTYTGLTTVTTGTLNTTTAQTGASAVLVEDAGTFGVSQLANGATFSVGTLSMGSSGGATLAVTPAAAPSAPLINATSFEVNGTTTLRVLGTPVSGTTLVSYGGGSVGGFTGFAGLTLAMPFRVSGNLTDTGSAIVLNGVVADTPRWRVGDGVWDIDTTAGAGGGGTANWKTNTNPTTTYVQDGINVDKVTFDDTATGTSPITVTLNTTVTPAGITFNGTKDYTVTGSGAIAGSSAIQKNGSGTFTLGTANTFTSAIQVNGGTLRAGIAGAFGSAISLTLSNVSGAALDLNGFNFTLDSLTGGGSTGGNVLLGGGVLTTSSSGTIGGLSGAGGIVKNGASTFTIAGDTTGYTGATTINSGVLDVGNVSNFVGASGVLTMANGAVLQGSGTITRTVGTGNAVVSANGGFAARGGQLDVELDNPAIAGGPFFDFNGSGNAFGGGLVLGSATADSKVRILSAIGINNFNGSRTISVNPGTGTASAELAGVVSNGGAANGGINKTGNGELILSGANTYTNDTVINAGSVTLAATGQLTFVPTTNGTVNKIRGVGSVTLNGAVSFNLAGANTTPGNTWKIVDDTVGTGLASNTLGASFSVVGFTESNDVWTQTIGANLWTFSEAERTLTVAPAAGFAGFISGTFANGTVPALQQGPNDDPDNDGISNLVEYAIAGQDPTVANTTIGTFTGNTLSFAKRQPLASDLTYAIEVSTDLGATPWVEAAGLNFVNDTTTISYLLPGAPAKNFMRLKVTKIP